ncbi:pyruvate dehydrogenase complex dihydrolipoamide acetyltransferase [Parasphingorhabdus sp. DH2-15]|uniref:pyruvate dehydrogenase complex dihydrolipoamide acetyltransferase n=1 Tax=Parasphingorhabdus sp. DH2-15 TaxID=3444112 RepID=UPI003F689378
MAVEIKMPALSPTMEEGTLAKWLLKEGDEVVSGDIMAEIETDKATMEFEAVDEGIIAKILVPEGSENVAVGTVIAILAEDGESTDDAVAAMSGKSAAPEPAKAEAQSSASEEKPVEEKIVAGETSNATSTTGTSSQKDGRVKASPLARRIASNKGVDLAAVTGTGPKGRIVKADVEGFTPDAAAKAPAAAVTSTSAAPAETKPFTTDIPHSSEKLNNVRKVIARRLTEAKQTVPHIYLTVNIQLDALLKLRGQLNSALESKGIKLSVNDLLIKALAKALMEVPKCNVSFAGDQLITYERADISVAVAAPSGLITPIIKEADTKSLSAISTEMKELAGKAREGKLQPHEYQGGTASISNMGMFGISQFDAVINPPQGMILAVGAGEKRPAVIDDSLQIATMMGVTGSFDHRSIDGADGAQLMKALKDLIENPMGLVA